MLDESKKIDEMEGKKEMISDDTSTSEENPVEPEVSSDISLDSTPEPTEEQKEDAGLTEQNPIEAEADKAEEDVFDMVLEGGEEGQEGHRPEDPIPQPEAPAPIEENGVTEGTTRTFTQSQVDDIAGKTRLETREKTFRYIYDRYGVNSEEELDELIGNAQRYDSLKEEYDAKAADWKQSDSVRNQEMTDIKEKLALMESGIDKDRYEDAKLILRGKGLEVTQENIVNELATHPEWKKESAGAGNGPAHSEFVKTGDGELNKEPTEPVSKISVLGNEPHNDISPEQQEEDYALNRLFK